MRVLVRTFARDDEDGHASVDARAEHLARREWVGTRRRRIRSSVNHACERRRRVARRQAAVARQK
eukprot:1935945-Pleurochrysis_carterae.AAC.1